MWISFTKVKLHFELVVPIPSSIVAGLIPDDVGEQVPGEEELASPQPWLQAGQPLLQVSHRLHQELGPGCPGLGEPVVPGTLVGGPQPSG